MSSRIERDTIIGSSQPPIWRRSQNQETQKLARDLGEQGFRNRDRVMRGLSRQERQERFLEELEEEKKLEEERDRGSLHALSHIIIQGVLDQGDVDFLLRYEETVDRFKTEKGRDIIITFVYLTPPNKNNK